MSTVKSTVKVIANLIKNKKIKKLKPLKQKKKMK